MNSLRIAGLILVAVLATWLGLRGCAPEENVEPVPPPAPARDQFHASKPLKVVAVRTAQAEGQAAAGEVEWLERELRQLLIRGRMSVAAIDAAAAPIYTLKVELPAAAEATGAKVALIAPDGIVDREVSIESDAGALSTMQALAARLPQFLGAAHASTDWKTFIGTDDEATYDSFLRSSTELLGANARGFTRPLPTHSSPTVDRLEALTRKQPQFGRALALLSVAYLSLGGDDQESLTRLSESTAEKALALDPLLTDAQSALALVRLRRSEWTAAKELFNGALKIDANAPVALEGLACLLVDAGHAAAALPVAQRAVALQPANIGGNECLIYAQLATATPITANATDGAPREPMAVAQAKALNALLSGDAPAAQQALRGAVASRQSAGWIDPVMRAAADRRQTSTALQAITRAARDGAIDAQTEVVCGAALRQADFVFNRMQRLQKQSQAVPLRILWLPNTGFLRQHPRFEAIVSAEGLLPFWQDQGPPDVCSSEPAVYGCKRSL